MTTDDKIRDEKLKYDINREASKISTVPSGKTDEYQYLAAEKILHLNQRNYKTSYVYLFAFRKSY